MFYLIIAKVITKVIIIGIAIFQIFTGEFCVYICVLYEYVCAYICVHTGMHLHVYVCICIYVYVCGFL